MSDMHIEAAAVLDEQVVGRDDMSLGMVCDLLIDARDGRIDYACIELRSGPVKRQVAYVPWSQFRVSADGCLRLDVSRETLTAFSRWQFNKKEES